MRCARSSRVNVVALALRFNHPTGGTMSANTDESNFKAVLDYVTRKRRVFESTFKVDTNDKGETKKFLLITDLTFGISYGFQKGNVIVRNYGDEGDHFTRDQIVESANTLLKAGC
jgi:hypothetical protein